MGGGRWTTNRRRTGDARTRPSWCVAAMLVSAPTVETLAQTRPNILFLLSDDHSAETVGFRPMARLGSIASTTNLNRIAEGGVVIDSCFTTLALCSPSRASILTGLYPHAHGVTQLRGRLHSGITPTFPEVLQEHGYATALFGKYHIDSRPLGFDAFEVFLHQGRYANPGVLPHERSTTRRGGYGGVGIS